MMLLHTGGVQRGAEKRQRKIRWWWMMKIVLWCNVLHISQSLFTPLCSHMLQLLNTKDLVNCLLPPYQHTLQFVRFRRMKETRSKGDHSIDGVRTVRLVMPALSCPNPAHWLVFGCCCCCCCCWSSTSLYRLSPSLRIRLSLRIDNLIPWLARDLDKVVESK